MPLPTQGRKPGSWHGFAPWGCPCPSRRAHGIHGTRGKRPFRVFAVIPRLPCSYPPCPRLRLIPRGIYRCHASARLGLSPLFVFVGQSPTPLSRPFPCFPRIPWATCMYPRYLRHPRSKNPDSPGLPLFPVSHVPASPGLCRANSRSSSAAWLAESRGMTPWSDTQTLARESISIKTPCSRNSLGATRSR